nr:aminoacyl-tRNA hydrolase [Evansella caseinilytica]
MKLIAGLGNPGMKYDGTRHNVGFDVIDLCAEKLGIELNKSKFKGVYGEKMINGEKIILLKPLTYMNLSGESVAPLMKFYRVEPNNLVVIYDDLDLGPGAVRLRQKGSAGGHNGMKSIIAHIGTEAFNRIRVGVGRPPKGEPVPDYVLGKPFAEERTAINEAVQKSAEAVVAWTSDTFIKVMNVYNK